MASRRLVLGGAAALLACAGRAHADDALRSKPIAIEKSALRIGFVPISCAAPLVMAHAKGFFSQEGLQVTLQKAASWALVRDNLLNGHFDASHLLSPMPLALSLGIGHPPRAVRAVTMQNLNGQAITLALKHHKRRDPTNWKGMTFAIPFEYSMHNFLLRAYLEAHGVDPDRNVTLRVTAPPDMVANLRAGNIDGFLGPEPFNQRAVIEEIGFIHILTADLWDGHPCCALGMTEDFIVANPGTYAAVQRAMIRAASFLQTSENRVEAAAILARPSYLNQAELIIHEGLSGRYADGLGVVQDNPHRAAFSPYPYYSMGTWMLKQMARWGYLRQTVDYNAMVQDVFCLQDVHRQAQTLGLPGLPYLGHDAPSFSVFGEAFGDAQNRIAP